MDINDFFKIHNTDTISINDDTKIDELRGYLTELIDKNKLTLLQKTYVNNFIDKHGTICGIQFMIKLLDELNINNIYDDLRDKICDIFGNIFKYDDSGFRINKNIRYKMSRLESIEFTKEQKNTLHELYDFVTDHKRSTFGLYGYAGTGKTTTLVEFISYLLKNKYITSVAFTAPTNKALNVIKMKFTSHLNNIVIAIVGEIPQNIKSFDEKIELLKDHKIVINFLTIHKLLCFKTDYSLDGNMIFVKNNKDESMISQFELVIIDECSMIGVDIIDNIFSEIRQYKISESRPYKQIPKIIFSGDPAQLPPVNEDNSSIFCKEHNSLSLKNFINIMTSKNNTNIGITTDFSNRYRQLAHDLENMDTVLLKTIVRSKIDEVTQVCYEFRKWIKTNTFPNLHDYKDKKGVEFFDSKKMSKTTSEWFNKFLESVKQEKSSIIITWTNRQTDSYNNCIRQQIFGKKTINKFEINDILMLNDFYGLDLGHTYNKQRLYTSEQIKVDDVKIKDVPIQRFVKIDNSVIKNMKQRIKFENAVHTLIAGLNETYCKVANIKCWILTVHKVGDDDDNKMPLIVIDDNDKITHEKNKNESAIAIKNFSKKLIDSNRSVQRQIENGIVKPLWKQWNKIFVEQFADVNYGYSITCHKAQGSSYYDVYIDLDDILQNNKSNEAKKCAYTAITRTSNELIILI